MRKANQSATFKQLADYVETATEAANDPVFGRSYPSDIYLELLKIRSKGDYSADEVLTTIQRAQDVSKFKDKSVYGYVKKTSANSFEMENVNGVIFTLVIHKKLADALGLSANIDYEPFDQIKFPDGNLSAMNLSANDYVTLKPLKHHTNLSSSVDLWSPDHTATDCHPDPTSFRHKVYHAIFVNTDLVQPHIVGNANANVLRIINVTPDQKNDKDRYLNPLFFKVKRPRFSAIEIYLTDEQGRDLNLNKNTGLTIITLIFKRLQLRTIPRI